MVYNKETTQVRQEISPFQDAALPLETRVNDLVSRFTLDEKIDLMCQYQPAISRLGIKAHKQGTEAAHGMAWLGEATSFPQPIGLGCTWNKELMKEIGDVIGTEARAFYKRNPEVNGLTLWAPTVDMERDPRWGRTEEAYGEDPHLTGKLAAQLVKGIQGDHPFYFKAVATLKHFLANNNEVDRGSCSASISPRNMHEYYLKAFELPVKEGGAYSMMTAYNSVNGIPALFHPYVKEIVKEKWGMNGFVVSDAGDLLGVVNDHKYYSSHAESAARAIRNGIDSITDDAEISTKAISEALKQGLLSENDLDHALRNAFRVRFRLGEFDPEELNPYAAIPESVICDDKHGELSLRSARESIVLLKNEKGTLPLDKNQLKEVAVIGPLANIVYRDWYSGTLPYKITPLKGIQEKLQNSQVSFHSGQDRVVLKSDSQYIGFAAGSENRLAANQSSKEDAEIFELTDWGWGNLTFRSEKNGKYLSTADDTYVSASADEVYGWFMKEAFHLGPNDDGEEKLTTWNHQGVAAGENGILQVLDSNKADNDSGTCLRKEVLSNGLAEAIKAAKESEAAIVFVGNNPLINGKEEIDREDITLAASQELLIQEVYQANPNTVVVVVGSYPFALNWVNEHIPAVLYTSHAGQEIGKAISDVLFGDYNPAGRLNMTWYKSIDQLPDLLDYDIIKGKRTYQYFDGEPLYPFGHGLSYSSFSCRKHQSWTREVCQNDEIRMSIEVTNDSSIPGDEVLQLYVRALDSSIPRPVKQLAGFERVHLRAGETRVIEFTLPASELAVWDVSQNQFVVESGDYELMAGESSASIKVSETLRVKGETIPARNLYQMTYADSFNDYSSVILEESEEGGACVQSTEAGAWIQFSDVSLQKGAHFFEARTATDSAEGGVVEIRLNSPAGRLIGELPMQDTGGLQSWSTGTCAIQLEESVDRQDVYLVFNGRIRITKFRFIA
ncbi:glycoside hydrolase family 3 protein [Mesobacillus foraminis]|uniref:glycoside hydrolase family 3 protein n=1 Tax=Mesobacillus foraminis TaxID=279826 RepID=UPI002035D316|nr:glycoside hydrolase family 3 protein [Mesobacillus foraminis]